MVPVRVVSFRWKKRVFKKEEKIKIYINMSNGMSSLNEGLRTVRGNETVPRYKTGYVKSSFGFENFFQKKSSHLSEQRYSDSSLLAGTGIQGKHSAEVSVFIHPPDAN